MNIFGAFEPKFGLVFFFSGAALLVGCPNSNDTGTPDTNVTDTDTDTADTGSGDSGSADGLLEVPVEYATIQEAVDAAASGDTISVAAGVYQEDLLLSKENILLVGAGAVSTIIEGTGTGSVITLLGSTGGEWTLSGITVTGGQQEDKGGGVLVVNTQLSIENSIVRANTAHWGGAGVAAIDGAHIIMNHVVLAENETLEGPGGGLLVRNGKVTIKNLRVIANHAWDFGGGIHLGEGARGWISFLDLIGNTARNGGGFYAENTAAVSLFATGTAYNISEDEGGGWYLEGDGVSASYVNFWDNSPDDVGASATPIVAQQHAFFVEPFSVEEGVLFGWDFDLHLSETSALINALEGWLDPDESTANLSSFGGPDGGGWDLDGDGFGSWWRAGTCDPDTVDDGLECNDFDASDVPSE